MNWRCLFGHDYGAAMQAHPNRHSQVKVTDNGTTLTHMLLMAECRRCGHRRVGAIDVTLDLRLFLEAERVGG